MTDGAFNLIAARIEELKREHERALNAELFRDAGPQIAMKPLTWRERILRRRDRARAYVSTLWRAWRGDDPYDVDWSDY